MGIIEELEWRDLISDCTDREGLQERLAKGRSPCTAALTRQLTACTWAASCHCWRCAASNFADTTRSPWPVGRPARSAIPAGNCRAPTPHARAVEGQHRGVKVQLGSFMEFEGVENAARLVDNADWTAPLSFLDVLRDIGKHFKVNAMVSKESVRARMETARWASATPSSAT